MNEEQSKTTEQRTSEVPEAHRYLLMRVYNSLDSGGRSYGVNPERARYLAFLCEMTLRESGVKMPSLDWYQSANSAGPNSSCIPAVTTSLLKSGELATTRSAIGDTSAPSYYVTSSGESYIANTAVQGEIESVISSVVSTHSDESAKQLCKYASNHVESPCEPTDEFSRPEATPETNYRQAIQRTALQLTLAILFGLFLINLPASQAFV